jgi:two-component system, sensor histidine kinase and response regulator
MDGKQKSALSKRRIRQLILLALISVTLLLGITSIRVYLFAKKLLVEETQKLNNFSFETSKDLNIAITDLLLFANFNETTDFLLTKRESSKRELQKEISNLLKTRQKYLQARILDIKGKEVVRVDYKKGSPIIIGDRYLQDKSKRYYFKNSIVLSKNQTYFSPLDLNVENERIEVPYEPVLRIAKPIFSKNRKIGVIILNFLARDIIRRLSEQYESNIDSSLLLNSKGYFLKATSPDREWGFMFPDKQKLTFGAEYPKEWDRISKANEGQFFNLNGFFSFKDISLRFIATYGQDRYEIIPSADYPWKAMFHVTPKKFVLITTQWLLPSTTIDFTVILVLVVVIWMYIRKRKQNIEIGGQLRKTFSQLKSIIQSATEIAIITTDTNAIITQFNPGAEKLLGFKEDELVGKETPKIFYSPSMIKQRAKEFSQKIGRPIPEDRLFTEFIKTGDTMNGECLFITKNGKMVPVNINITPQKNEFGKTEGLLIVAQDITDRKKVEEQLLSEKEAAEIANRFKSEFLANISHEIRTPLNSILGISEILLNTEVPKDQFMRLVKTIDNSSNLLLGLINDILDISKIEAGKLELDIAQFSVRKVVEDACEIFTFIAAEKDLELVSDVSPEVEGYYDGDANRLRQILINFIGNAIKFTDQGEIVVKADKTKRKGKDFVRFSVSDTGRGIPERDQYKIFQKFTQIDASSTKRFKGTGLGLNISKSLTELMGGKAWFDSEEGKGSVFYSEIPLEKSETSAPEFEVDVQALKDVSVLFVCVGKDLCNSLKHIFSSYKIKNHQVNSLDELLSLSKTEKHNTICIGYRMLAKEGSVEKLREIKKNQKRIIIILNPNRITDVTTTYPNLFSAQVAKPVKKRDLLEALTGKKMLEIDKTQKPDRKRKLPVRLLIAEDNIDNQNLFKLFLDQLEYEYKIVPDGKVALEEFKHFKYDMILTDIQMPDMDGLALTKKIRQMENEEKLPQTPIIAVSAYATTKDREKAIKAGANDYLTKPVKRELLDETIKKWFRPTVLITDDSPDNINLFKLYTKDMENIKTIFADNGQKALDYFGSHSVSLIFMDMEMPIMNGLEAAIKIRELDDTKIRTPIVSLSGHSLSDQKEFCRDCNEYLQKPVKKEQFLEVLKKYTE